MRGTVGILTGKGPACDPLQDWLDLLPADIKRHRIQGNEIAYQRNEVLRHREGDWVLFVDADCIPSFGALDMLLAHDLPLVSGTVLERTAPFAVCAVKSLEPYTRWRAEDLPRAVFPVPAVGTGCLLLREAVIQAVGDPWFRCGQIHPELLSEDFDFSLRASECGFPPYLDPLVRVGHETRVILWPGEDGIQAQWPNRTGWAKHRQTLDEVFC